MTKDPAHLFVGYKNTNQWGRVIDSSEERERSSLAVVDHFLSVVIVGVKEVIPGFPAYR